MAEKFNKYMEKILRKMCELANVKFKEIDFKKDGWFSEHTITKEQEKEFKKWFIDYLYNNSKVQKDLYGYYRKIKKLQEKRFLWFNLNYGWRVGDENYE